MADTNDDKVKKVRIDDLKKPEEPATEVDEKDQDKVRGGGQYYGNHGGHHYS